MIKTVKNGHRRNLPHTIKFIYNKPTANTILLGEKWEVLSLKSGIRQGCPLSPSTIQHSFESPSHCRGEKEPKGIQIGKEVKILTVCRYHVENLKNATRKLLELINEFSKIMGYKINTQKSLAFL